MVHNNTIEDLRAYLNEFEFTKHHQITIDIVEKLEDVLLDNTENFNIEKLGSIGYKISTLLEIISPDFIADIKTLKNLYGLIEKIVYSERY